MSDQAAPFHSIIFIYWIATAFALPLRRFMMQILFRPRLFSNLLFCIIAICARLPLKAQEQPFSRNDSAVIAHHLPLAATSGQAGDFRAATKHCTDIAYLYWDHNMYQEAIVYYEKALVFAEKLGNENGISMICGNLGMLYSDLNNYPQALINFNRTLAARKYFGEKNSIVAALVNKSVVLGRLGRYKEALACLDEATTLAREMNDIKLLGSCYSMLSETYAKMNDGEQTLYYFRLYQSLSELSTRNERDAIENDLLRAQLAEFEKQGKAREADSIRKALSQVSRANVKLYKDLSRNEIEIELLKKDASIQELRAQEADDKADEEKQRARIWLIAMVLVSAFLGIIAFLILRSNRKKNRYNALLKERNDVIAHQNEALTSLNGVKDKLFSIISHDLRGPIATLKGSMGLIQSGALNEEQRSFIFDSIGKELDYTLELIETLLHWAKSQMTGISLKKNPTSTNDVVTPAVQVLQAVAKRKNISLKATVSTPIPFSADEEMVKLVVRNLISNAIKFTPNGGKITVSAEDSPTTITIRVKDTGIGLSAGNVGRLFQNATHFTTQGTQKEKGTGLGLIMCRDFVKLHEGRIWVESTLGKGSTFAFTLPK